MAGAGAALAATGIDYPSVDSAKRRRQAINPQAGYRQQVSSGWWWCFLCGIAVIRAILIAAGLPPEAGAIRYLQIPLSARITLTPNLTSSFNAGSTALTTQSGTGDRHAPVLLLL